MRATFRNKAAPSKPLSKVPFVLWLNKRDLFEKKIEAGANLA